MLVWMYNKEGARLFEDGEDIPKDFVDCPTKVKGEKTYTLDEVKGATDAAIEAAEALDIDLGEVEGTGKDGNILKADVELEALREEAESLGLKVHHKAKAETIRKQIEEAKA